MEVVEGFIRNWRLLTQLIRITSWLARLLDRLLGRPLVLFYIGDDDYESAE